MALGAMIGAFGANIRLASSAAIGATTMLQVMGNAQKSRRIVRSARSTAHMFSAMRRAASSAGIMKELMETFGAVFILLKPFLPFLKLLGATIQLYLLPLVKEMTEAFKPLYKSWGDMNKALKDSDNIYSGWLKNFYEMFKKINDVSESSLITANSVELMSTALTSVNSPMITFVSELSVAKSGLISVNDQLGDFADLIETIGDLASSVTGGGGNGGDDNSDGGGGGGGIDFPDLPNIPPIIFLQKGGIPTKPTLGVVEPHEAVIPLDTLEFTFQDLKSAASSTNLLLAKNNRLLEKLARRLA